MSAVGGFLCSMCLIKGAMSDVIAAVCDVIPFPVSAAPAAPSRWHCRAERRSELSPANTTDVLAQR